MQQSGVAVPDDLGAKFLEKQKTQEVKAEKKQAAQRAAAPPSSAGGGANPAEVKDLKIKLSHKEREVREL